MAKKQLTWTNEKRKLRDLTPWEHNPRYIKDKQAERLLESFTEFGQVLPICIDPRNSVLDGHQRRNVIGAADEYGLDYEVDVRVASRELTERERQKLTVYLHKGAAGDWSNELLFEHFNFDDLALWGFDTSELDAMFADVAPELPEPSDAAPQTDKAAELLEKWKVKVGDLWRIGDHRLACGDCTDPATVAKVMVGGEKADMMLTDPPYGIGADKSMHEKGGQQYGKAAAPKRHYAETDWDNEPPSKQVIDYLCTLARDVVLWGGNYFDLPPTRCYLVWDKQNDGNQFADCELAWTNLDKPVRLIRHLWNGMLREGKEERLSHPTQKPLGVIAWAIEQCSDGQIVLDTYAGTGTTIVACQNLQRKARAIELSAAYCSVILQRMSDAFPDLVIERIC